MQACGHGRTGKEMSDLVWFTSTWDRLTRNPMLMFGQVRESMGPQTEHISQKATMIGFKQDIGTCDTEGETGCED